MITSTFVRTHRTAQHWLMITGYTPTPVKWCCRQTIILCSHFAIAKLGCVYAKCMLSYLCRLTKTHAQTQRRTTCKQSKKTFFPKYKCTKFSWYENFLGDCETLPSETHTSDAIDSIANIPEVIIDYGDDLILWSLFVTTFDAHTFLCVNKNRVSFLMFSILRVCVCVCVAHDIFMHHWIWKYI